MKKIIFIMLFITSSLLASYQAPLKVQGSTTIDSKKAFELYNKGVKFLDVRPLRFLKSGKIKNSIHLYVDKMTKTKLEKIINKDEKFVIYCNGAGCPLSAKAIKLAVEYGYTKIYYYRDGIPAWDYYKFPISKELL